MKINTYNVQKIYDNGMERNARMHTTLAGMKSHLRQMAREYPYPRFDKNGLSFVASDGGGGIITVTASEVAGRKN